MLTVMLTACPEQEMFSQGLDFALNAADGAEPCQVIVSGSLLESLCQPASAQKPEYAAVVRQLTQLELFELPVFTCPHACAALPFAAAIGFNELYRVLQQSRQTITF